MPVDFGGFTLTDDGSATNVDGKVADGVVPLSVLESLVAEGGCEVLRRNNPFCDPTCAPGEVCDFDGSCLPYPTNQDVGVVQILGLREPVSMEPVFPGNTYYDTSLTHPAMTSTEVVHLSVPGGAFGPADLHGVWVESMQVVDSEWAVVDGKDLAVSWSAPEIEAPRSEVVLTISIDQHGVSPSILRCAFADTGTAAVPSAVIAVLVGAGVTGFPNGSLERRTVDKVEAEEGCFDFAIRSPRSVEVSVSGHTPCVSTADCPGTEECNEELQTCE